MLIVAGYQGVGKSTLLMNALKNKIPLFGTIHSETFYQFQFPPSDQTPDVDTIVQQRYWFSNRHLPILYSLTPSLDHLLIHIDLLKLMLSVEPLSTEMPLPVIFPRSIKSLTDESDNKSVMQNIFRPSFLGEWDKIAINTYILPYEINCQRWQQRKTSNHRFSVFFDKTQRGETVHRVIHSSWFSFLDSLNSVERYRTTSPEPSSYQIYAKG